MNLEKIREYCLAKPETTESFPFDEDALVFKVFDKMFALVSLSEKNLSLKCDPDLAVQLREEHSFVLPGYHFNKKHWNTVYRAEEVKDELIKDWIDHSFEMVISKLPKTKREQLKP